MTQREKQICILLAGIAVFTALGVFLPRLLGSSFVYYLKPLIWLALSAFIWFQPRVRAESKMKMRAFLLLWVIITAALYNVTYFGAGIALGALGKSPFSKELFPMLRNVLAFVSVPVMAEWVRNWAINGAEKKRKLLFAVIISVLFTAMQLNFYAISAIKTLEDFASFAGGDLLPLIMLNAFLSYVVYLGGAETGMLYMAITASPIWLLPVLPDLNWLVKGLVGTVFPLFSLYVLRDVYRKRTGQAKLRETAKENPYGWIGVLAVCIVLVWFIAGLFPIYPVTIMSGSMEPYVFAGDVVLIERAEASSLKKGDIVQYWSNDFFIIHRIVDIDKLEGKTVYITKGDNNNVRDIKPVSAEQIRGKVIGAVPKLGMLTYLFRSR